MRFVVVLLALFLAGALGWLVPACAHTLPADPSSAALYRDMQRLVSLRDAAGWQIDRLEIEGMLPDVLMSFCQVEPAARAALATWLEMRITALGGPVERAFRERGKKRGRVAELLELTRIRDALAHAMAVAAKDCPFWLEPGNRFAGRQISDDRWQLTVGGGGKGILVNQGSTYDLRFGGAGRILFGRNVGSRLAFFSGLESGASAAFPRTDDGQRGNLILSLDAVIPLVVRYKLVNAYFEFEAGYLANFTEDDLGAANHGIHLGVAVGGRASRVRWFFPGAAFGISFEETFEPGANLILVKLGFRAAIDWDF